MEPTKNHQGFISSGLRQAFLLTAARMSGRLGLGLAIIAMALAFFTPMIAKAAVITVCSTGCNQTDLAAAVAAASAGDTIVIGPGTYPVDLDIAKNLTLQGAGAGQTILNGHGVVTGDFSGTTNVVKVETGATVNLQGVTVTGGYPAGLWVNGTLTVSDSAISGNEIGAINGGFLTVLRSTISGNVATTGFSFEPGGLLASAGSTTNLFESAVVNNSGYDDGGITIDQGLVFLSNSTVSGNSGYFANNISFLSKGGSLGLANSTVVNSGSGQVPSIGVFGAASTVAILAGNSILYSPTEPNCEAGITPMSTGHNLSNDNSCNLDSTTDLVNNPNILLGPLQTSSPGTTPTHSPGLGSAAIDAGDCGGGSDLIDQRGVARPQGPACDIGAVEIRLPNAASYAYGTSSGKTLVVPAPGVFTNSSSPEAFPLSISAVGTPSHGTLYAFADGSFQYVPAPGFVGQDSFTYSVTDTIHTSAPATVSINVTVSNYPPVAGNDSYTTVSGGVLRIAAAQGVLANDKDPDGDPITAVLLTPPTYGGLTLNSDGSFVYGSKPGFIGTDTFTYAASDGQARSNPATVSITVTPNYGSITIGLGTLPQSSLPFSFTSSFGSFTLGGTNAASKTFQAQAGTFSFTELRPKPWLMYNILCSAGPGVVVDLTKRNAQITLLGGENQTCTFVNALPGQVVARVFNDLNSDGKREKGEPLLTGITMQLYTNPYNLVKSVTVDSSGKAAFGNLWPQVYTVCEVVPNGWMTTNPPVVDPAYGKPCITINAVPGGTVPTLFGTHR